MSDTVSKSERSRIMRAVRGKHTAPEMVVRRIAHRLGFRYRLHVRSLPGTPDLVFPKLRKVIDVRGCFWHVHARTRCRGRGCRVPATRRGYWVRKLRRNVHRDRVAVRALRRAGWHVLVVWECEVQNQQRIAGRIAAFLRGDC
jgi:DNA mismatch endonuclease (patch repair protein)